MPGNIQPIGAGKSLARMITPQNYDALELAGYRIEDAIAAAARKDAGLTAAQLGWVLGQMKLGADLSPPGSASLEQLRLYLADLIGRLARLAFPG